MRMQKWAVALLLLAMTCGPFDVSAKDWPHWRGLTRDGHTTEVSGWNGRTWIKETPDWSAEVGEGASSPLVVGDLVYTLGWGDDQDTLWCLDLPSGQLQWKVSHPSPQWGRFHEGDEGVYSGACSTPEFDLQTGLIYSLGIDGDLICRDTQANGKRLWSRNLYEEFDVKKRPRLTRAPLRDYGYTSSPLIYNNWVLVEAGAPTGCLIAFDKKTGRTAWASECTDPAGHNGGPVLIVVEEIPCVALFTINGLVVIRLDEANAGKTVAQYLWITDFANNVASLAVQENNVLITSQYNHRSIARLAVRLSGIEKVWEVDYSSKVCTPVIHKGHVYFAWQRLHCLDWETGQQKWEGGNFSDPGSCLVTSDDRLIVYGYHGKLALVETAVRSPDEYKEVFLRDHLFRQEAWPHVVLSNGRVLCRDRLGHLLCFTTNE